ncbi:uncharacterized protein P884DRAFT_256785 [Thermothelomyces heterothallicus CBS 202.75]|uniref:uncharacterized protein n=1 Tax=Thermothelomyces heterothallicus CBS 202.75 TaxID=1149848 RepID=UPI003742732A
MAAMATATATTTTTTTRRRRGLSGMARLAGLVAILALLQPALASFYTVTEYYLLVESVVKLDETCTEDCYYYTDTDLRTVKPTVTPTAKPVSTSTWTYTYNDVEIVSVFLTDGVGESDLVPTTTTDDNLYTDFAVMVTWTAPSSCPTPFTVVSDAYVYIPYDVRPYLEAESTATTVYTDYEDSVHTYLTKYIDPTAVPPTARPTAQTTDYEYSYYIKNCRNPTATDPSEYYGPTYTAGSGGSRGGSGSYGGGDRDSTWCSTYTGCVVAAWVIAVATVLPTIFLLGFVESYLWFRRMMLGKPALRLGTICWCCLSLWFILLTRRSPGRSPEDQVLLRQYWDTLGAGTRIKLWFKHGFRWRYPVELIGNPDGNNPVIPTYAPPPPPPPPPPVGGPDDANGSEKAPFAVHQQQQQQQAMYAPSPFPGGPPQQPYYMQPFPGQPYYPPQGPPPPGQAQGYGMAMPAPPPGAYVPGQQPRPAAQPQPQQQQHSSSYSPSPAPTGATEMPSQQSPSGTGSAAPGTEQQPQQH